MKKNHCKIKYLMVALFVGTLLITNIIYGAVIIAPNDYNTPFGSPYQQNYGYPPNYAPNYPSYYDPYYNPYNVPYTSPYYQYNYNPYAIPNNSYYYIMGYDRGVPAVSGGEAMVTRVPIIGGNYTNPVQIANNLVYGSYRSISKWCNENILNKDSIQDYFLNYASIERETPFEIVMIVNCAIKKRGIIDSHIEFRVTLNISTNRYKWRKLSDNATSDGATIYEYDSDSGDIIIIR